MQKYNCKQCGAELYFNPKTGKLECEYCGSSYDPSEYNFAPAEPGEAVDETIAQTADAEGLEAAATDEASTDDSIGDLVVYKCPHCGAEVITSKETAATTCVYCNRAVTLEGNLTGDFRPKYIVPFTQDRKDVEAAYLNLCRQSPLTPRLFTREATVKKIKGMYVPYWLYSFEGEAVLQINAANIRTYRTGEYRITETSTYQVEEGAAGAFEYIPADAVKEMDNTMMDSLEPFDFSKMQPFNTGYLAGFYTQRWNETSQDNINRAKARAKESLANIALKHAGKYDTIRVASESFNWKREKADYAMMPVWMMYTEYKGKNYLFAMNGQTGRIVGEIPKDPMVIVKRAGLVVLISQIVMMILRIMGVM